MVGWQAYLEGRNGGWFFSRVEGWFLFYCYIPVWLVDINAGSNHRDGDLYL